MTALRPAPMTASATFARRRAGALRHRVVIEVPDDAPDGAGGLVRGWRRLAVAWGSVEPWDGAGAVPELVGEAPSSVARLRVTLRWRQGITGAARLRLGARVLELRGVVDPDERRRWLVLDAEEVRA